MDNIPVGWFAFILSSPISLKPNAVILEGKMLQKMVSYVTFKFNAAPVYPGIMALTLTNASQYRKLIWREFNQLDMPLDKLHGEGACQRIRWCS